MKWVLLRRIVISLAASVVGGCVFSSGAFAQSAVPASVQQLIPAGRYQVDVMERVFPKQLTVILQKMKAAAAAHPKEFQALASHKDPTKPLPYDPVLGITRAEYVQLNTLQPTSQKTGTGELQIDAKDGQRLFKASAAISALNGMTIDLNRGIVFTSYGALQKYSVVKATTKQTTTGPWDGISWTYDQGASTGHASGKTDLKGSLQVNVGKMKSNGKTLLTLHFEPADHSRPQDYALVMIQFNSPHKSR